jgi:selenocysteine-specific elongation factor
LLKSGRPLRDRARVHLHAYTAEAIAEVVLYGQKQLAPGQSGYAQLRLSEPMLLLPGDRFILRQFSPVVTIGGGVMLDAAPFVKRSLQLRDFLQTVATGSREEILSARIARRHTAGLSIAGAVAETGWPQRVLESLLATLIKNNRVVRIGNMLLSPAAFETAKSAALTAVNAFHNANPLVSGISKEELREKINVPPEVFAAVLEGLVCDKKIEISGEQVRVAGRGVVLKDEEAQSKKIIESAFSSAGLKVPALKDVLAAVKVDRTRAQKIVTLLLRDKVLIKVSEDLVFHQAALDDLRRRMAAQKNKSPKIDVAQFKDLTGVSRKYAIPLLEYLDRERVTRRVGDQREIL